MVELTNWDRKFMAMCDLIASLNMFGEAKINTILL